MNHRVIASTMTATTIATEWTPIDFQSELSKSGQRVLMRSARMNATIGAEAPTKVSSSHLVIGKGPT